MVGLEIPACLHQRGERALHPFLHGGHSLRVPLQPQKETSVLRFNALHDSRRTEGADPHPRRGGIHRLMVDAVGQQLVAAHETVQKRAGKHPGGMIGGIAVLIVPVVLPGGFGTLEEFFEVLTLKQLGRHNPAIAILNTNGFYDKMQAFVLSAVEQNFIRPACLNIYALCPTPADTLTYLEQYDPAALDVRHLKNI